MEELKGMNKVHSFLSIYYSNWLESYKQIDTNYTDYLREKTERSSRTNFFVVIGKRSFLPPTTIGLNIFWWSILILLHFHETYLRFCLYTDNACWNLVKTQVDEDQNSSLENISPFFRLGKV